MKRFILISALVIFAAGSMLAGKRGDMRTKMREYRHDFIVEKINVSASQKQEFLSLYESMEDEIYNANKTARELAKKVEDMTTPAEADYQRAAEALVNAKYQEGQIDKAYFEKFAKVLTKKQLFQLKQAEIEFTRSMLKKQK